MQHVVMHLRELATKKQRRILLPEWQDVRILEAASRLATQGICKPYLLGNEAEIRASAKKQNITLHPDVHILDQKNHEHENADLLCDLRAHKGMTKTEAHVSVSTPMSMMASCLLLRRGIIDGVVAGATHTTADTLRPALQVIKTTKDHKIASSYFLMVLHDKIRLFADCALNIVPSAEELAEIAISTANSANELGMTPKVAMLSFSTHGSSTHESVQRITQAVDLVHTQKPHILCDGELQVDAAIVAEIADKKAPNSVLKGKANILIFPDLNSGNIAYKLVERLGKAQAIGPIVQGLRLPVNDLSRGCSVEDIVTVCAITALQSHEEGITLHEDHKHLLS